jgi:hypothetical protein
MREMRTKHPHTISIWKSQGKKTHGRAMLRSGDNIKLDSRGYEGGDWIKLAKNRA